METHNDYLSLTLSLKRPCPQRRSHSEILRVRTPTYFWKRDTIWPKTLPENGTKQNPEFEVVVVLERLRKRVNYRN
jgi:hypothetical protein